MARDTPERRSSVHGALVTAMLLATWWVRLPSVTDTVGKPTQSAKQRSRQDFEVVEAVLSCFFTPFAELCMFEHVLWCVARALRNLVDRGLARTYGHHHSHNLQSPPRSRNSREHCGHLGMSRSLVNSSRWLLWHPSAARLYS